MRSLALLLTTLLLSTIAACGGDDDSPPLADAAPTEPDAAPGTTVASFCHALSTEICAGLSSCSCRFDTRTYDAAGCVDARTAECSASLGRGVGADLASGQARFDDLAVTRCLGAVEALARSCDVGNGFAHPLPDACQAFVIANVPVGSECHLTSGGLAFCGASGEGLCVPDGAALVCKALPVSGACLNGFCAAGLVCNGEICVPPVAEARECLAPDACAPGLVCDATHRCGPPIGEGADCEYTLQCAEGLECRSSKCMALSPEGGACTNELTCGAGRACTSAPETRTCGDAGGVGAACSEGTCGDGLTCTSDGMCATLPGVGAACLEHRCADGLTCDDGTVTCVALPGIGETCAAGDRFCAVGLGCRQSDNTCQAGGGIGEDCLLNPPDYVCGDGLGCFFNMDGTSTCEPLADVGGVCSTFRNCVTSTYCDLASLMCLPRLGAGTACTQGDECGAGLDCRPVGGRFVCAATPAAGEPCFESCPAESVCQGPGGECGAAFCTL
jgi:hypothetical protein